MDRIAKALMNHDEVYADISNVLFGDGAEELISKLSQTPEAKAKRKELGRQVGYATNAAGMVAGPAAVWQATKHRKGGGVFRDIGESMSKNPKVTGSKFKAVRSAGKKAGKIADTLSHPTGKGSKLAAGAAGVTMIGLQGANWAGDTIAAQTLKKKPENVKKDSPDGADLHVAGGMKAKPVKVVINESLPVLSAKANLATAKGKKKLGQSAKAGREKFEDVKANLKKADEVDVKWEGEIAKFDEDKRQVFGYASVVEVNGEPVIDKQGDYISIDEVEKSAYDYVQKSRKGGNMHKRDGDEAHHVSDMIESFVITPEKIEKMGLPEETPVGWWIGFQVNDEDTWDEVKKGDLTGFSIHGKGSRTDGTI